VENDFLIAGSSSLKFVRYYSSTGFYSSPGVERARDVLGVKWRHNWQSAVVVEPATVAGQDSYAYVVLPDGDYRHFRQVGVSWVGRTDKSESLVEITTGGVRSGWVYTTSDDSVYKFDANGRWLSLDQHGRLTALSYSDAATPISIAPKPGLLIRVTDAQGRFLEFRYDKASYLIQVNDSAGSSYGYRYAMHQPFNSQPMNTGLLRYVDLPGGVSREYVYDEAGNLGAGNIQTELLTGIVDEKGSRYATFQYDSVGRAWKEWHGADADVLSLIYQEYSYNDGISHTKVANSLGQSELRNFVAVAGIVRDAGVDRCTTSACSAYTASSSKTYDANGNLDVETDFNGAKIDHDYNSRGLETQRVDAKSVVGSTSPAEKRTTQTDWHASFHMPTERRMLNASSTLEAKTQWAYNGRGQATARCEIDPADAAAMAYSCSATTAPPAGAKVRRTVTTYCEPGEVTAGTCPLVGLVRSVNGARPANDAGMATGQDDVTSYTYYPTDDATCASNGACPHRKGDLWKVTNALGQVVEFVSYDKNGRVTRQKDANGTLTDFAYHPRGWLTTRTVRAQASGAADANDATTQIDYDAVGNVLKVTQADGAYLGYTYDAAHRLIKIADNLANTIDYCPGGVGSADCLDAAGNRKVEQTKDPSGTLKRSLRRQYDQLSQLQKTLNAANDPTLDATNGYDGNGNLTQSADGLGTVTRQQYDGLNRLVSTIQNYNGTDTATKDATTGYVYDSRDNLRSVTDPDGLVTNYTYDGLNNLTALSSPDTGSTGYTYDAAGNRTGQTDARGITSTYTYDALNRLTGIGYPTTSLNVSYAYDQANATTGCATSYPTGRLTRMTDSSGSTTYCYDRRGNVTKKTQVTAVVGGPTSLVTQYVYTKADRLVSITYPSGAIVSYGRDSTGRITSVSWKANGLSTPITLVSSASYYPYGPLNTLTFGNGRTLTKAYDQNYAIDAISSSATGGLTLDIGVDVMGNLTQASGTLNPATPERTYQYDRLYRLTGASTGATPPSPLEAYAYSKTGDRQSASLNGAASTAYAYTAGSHRLASVGGTSRSYDANGNTLTGTAANLSLGYDDRNRLTTAVQSGGSFATTYGFSYNGRGERVMKGIVAGLSSMPPILYSYDENGQLLGEYNNTAAAQAEYVYLDTLPIAVVKSGSPAYIETDHLGTPRQVVDRATNAVLWRWDFLGNTFGANAANASPGGGVAYPFNLRFPGQYFDTETGLHYNYFRDYEAATGRYVESDPVGLKGGINPYSYCASVIYCVDPYGLHGLMDKYDNYDFDSNFIADELKQDLCLKYFINCDKLTPEQEIAACKFRCFVGYFVPGGKEVIEKGLRAAFDRMRHDCKFLLKHVTKKLVLALGVYEAGKCMVCCNDKDCKK
jgi:RHS repeat-associated protein